MHIDNLFDELPEQLTKSDKQLLSVITGIKKSCIMLTKKNVIVCYVM